MHRELSLAGSCKSPQSNNLLKACSHGLFQSLVWCHAERVLGKQNISGLYHATASIRSLLKSGLGRFGLQKQPHPADNAVVILFVVGGISMLELREIQQAVDNQISQGGKLPQLLTGGTALLHPTDFFQNLCSRKPINA